MWSKVLVFGFLGFFDKEFPQGGRQRYLSRDSHSIDRSITLSWLPSCKLGVAKIFGYFGHSKLVEGLQDYGTSCIVVNDTVTLSRITALNFP